MKLIGDYHTHTIYSHGRNTIEENVVRAIEIGLKEIAICDHGPGHLGFGIKKKKITEMRDKVDRLNDKYPDIKILLGMECNILGRDGKIDIDDFTLPHLDIVLAGYHFGSMPDKLIRDSKIHLYNYLSKKNKYYYHKVKEMNTDAFVNAIKKYDIDLITHPGAKGPIIYEEVAQIAASRNTALEINNSHGHLTVEGIKKTMKYDINYYINSDAHHTSDIGKFSKSLKRAKEAGLDLSRIVNLSQE